MARRRGVPVLVWLTEEEFARLSADARKAGYQTVSDYLRDLVSEALEARPGAPPPAAHADPRAIADSVARRLERVIVDLLNPFTGKIDEVNRRLAELVEALEERKPQHPEEAEERPQAPPAARPPRPRAQRGERRESGVERFHREGVVFESDFAWMKSPERFFKKLEAENAVVLDFEDERVYVAPEFWDEFKRAVSEIGVSDRIEAANLLRARMGSERGARAARLFEKLAKAGMAYYDEEQGRWVIEE